TDPRYQIGSTDWYHTSSAPFNWTITPQTDTTLFAPVTGATNPPDAGNDVIYAGDGNDHVWAGDGSDVVYGEGGQDDLIGEAGNDILFGGAGDDNISGDASYIDAALHGDDYLDGGDGNDTLYGDGGNDTLIGGSGNDQLDGGAGTNYLDGGDGNDTLYGDSNGNTLLGGAGDDELGISNASGNFLDGGTGNDTLTALGGGNYLDGGDGADTLYADMGGNELFGGRGDDSLSAAGGNNYLDGEEGNNTLLADGGGNELFAGAGNDTLSSGGGNSYLDAGDGNNTLIATGGNNTLYAGTGNDSLSAGGGNNYLDGGAGADTLIADGGNNTLIGGAGDDILQAYGGGNTLDGGDGRDLYVFDAGFGINHIADSGAGGNTLRFNFSFAGSGIVVGLGSLKLSFTTGDELHIDNFDPNDPTNTCSIDTFVFNDQTLNLQNILDLGGPAVDFTRGPDIIGTANADTLLGTDKSEHIYGLAGNDTINAGARDDYIEGGAGNDVIDGGAGADVMYGGTGNDTYHVDNAGDQVIENLMGTTYSSVKYVWTPSGYIAVPYDYVIADSGDTVNASVSFTLGNNLENLNLTGADNIDGTGNALDNVIVGNDGNNLLSGGAGVDWLDGGAGNDTLSGGTGDDTLWGGADADAMAGGAGSDTYYVDNAGDQVTENLNEGWDLVQSSVTYTLGANVEDLNLDGTDNINGTGNELDNRINGNSGDNILQGGAGNDRLFGYGGADTMEGGAGNDTYVVDNIGDVIVENLNEGTDLVYSSISYTLTDNVENLTLDGQGNTGTGNAQNNVIIGYNANISYALSGGAGNDTLTGNNGSDTLDGGSGTDVMNGGYGDDTYHVDNAGDQVIENFAGRTYYSWGWQYTIPDTDTVNASISYTLGNNLENLNLTGAGNINGTGNALDNIINGNDGNNSLSGGAGNDILNGGAGADVMNGGAGNDTYYVDNAGDQVIEAVVGQAQWWNGQFVAGDAEQVYSLVSFTLGANLEYLTLTGSDNIDGAGNALANVITGNDGINVLSGGAGDDTYYVQTVGDTVIEGAGNGYDRVYTNVDFLLSGNTEFLSLNDGAVIGIGDDSDNIIEGNRANNVLEGRAGNDHLDGYAGNDTISGGDGNDTIYGGYDSYYQDENGWGLISNSDVLDGGAGDDNIDGGSGNDTISGGTGNDVLFGGYDDGGEGADPLPNNDTIDGGEGDDSIDGGSGADRLYGGAGNDYIYGGDNGWSNNYFDYARQISIPVSSNDFLDGGDGNDILDGGSGADTLLGGAGNDELYGGDGWGEIYDPVSDSYIAISNDDSLDGGDGNDQLYGQEGNDVLLGGAGDDVIEGGNGNDLLDGGTGSDYLYGGDGNDVLQGSRHTDLVTASASLAAPTGSLTINAAMEDGAIPLANLTGIAANYTLQGIIGDGPTTDQATGNGWDYDFYKFSNLNAGYAITVATFTGFDTVIGLYDAAGNLVAENDDANGAGGSSNGLDSSFTFNISVGGDYYLAISDYANYLPTNPFDASANGDIYQYSYSGGAYMATVSVTPALDWLEGGLGDDTYVVGGIYTKVAYNTINECGDIVLGERLQWTTDTVTEYAGEGYDIVMSSASFTLSADVEELYLTFDPNTAQSDAQFYADLVAYGQDGTGNDLDNVIVGNELNNRLDGGFGADTLEGGAGNDTYVIDQAGDTIIEQAGGGIDTVESSISYELLDPNLENLTLLDGAASGFGNAADNVINGNAGFNDLYGGDGNDTLIANGGGDELYGGAGNDRYVFRLGDGAVWVADNQGADTVFIGNDLTVANLATSRSGDDLVMSVIGTADSVTLSNWFAQADGVSRIEFCDGTALDKAGIEALFNAPPVANADAVTVSEDAGISTIAVADLLANDTDPNAGDTLNMVGFDAVTALGNTVTLDANGNLALDIGNCYQSLGAGQTAMDSFSYTIADAAGLTSTATADVTIAGVNDAPVAATAIAGQQTSEDAPFSFTVPAGTFADIDNGDTLTYSATLADGTALPSWLTFDAATQTFSGTPLNADVGNMDLLVTATDTGGLSASSAFNLNVINVNDAPTANADAGAATEDGGAVLLSAATLLANDTDPDFIHGDVLSIVGVSQAASGAAVSLMNGAVQYDIGTLFQSLAQGQTATDTFSYTVSDMAGATSTATVTMTVTGVNDGPVTVNDAAAVQEDLALVATGNVLANDSDVDQGTVLSVANAGTLQGNYGSLILDADGNYSYALDNTSVAVQGLMAGQTVTETFAYQATDGIAATPATLTVTITGSNDAPVAQNDVATVNEDSLLSIQSGALLANDTDADIGDTKVLVGVDAFSALGSSVSLVNGQVVYDQGGQFNSLMAGQSVIDSFSYTMTDSAGAASNATVNVTITGVNDGPTANTDVVSTNEDTAQTTLSTASLLANDTDPDSGDVLSIAGFDAVSSQGNAVRAGNLVFDIGNRYQYLAQGETLTDTFNYTVTDTAGATSTAQVGMTITGINDAPVAAADVAYVREDLNITATGNVLGNDTDIDQGTVLSVADAGVRAGSYGSLNLAADGSYSYALDNASMSVQSLGRSAQAVEHFGYTATDGMVGASSVLDVFLNGANDAPILVAPLADQDFTFNKHFSWQMPEGSFTDIDQGDTLGYAAMLADGSALPDWLSFDAATRTFSGETPKEVGFVDVQVTATDSVAATGSTVGSLSASDVFRISVSHGNEGVGNGKDAPPPGHDHNSNDGTGTSPGHPGSKGGNSYPTASDGTTSHSTKLANNASQVAGYAAHPNEQQPHDRSSDAGTHKDDTPTQDTGNSDSRRTDELISSWFNEESASERYSSFSALDRHSAWGGQIDWQVNRNVANGVSGDVSAEWEQMNAQLKKHLEQSGGDDGHFSESGTGSRSFGLFGSGGQQGIPQLGMGNGQQLKALGGLKEGLERLGG
ncbi:MAG: Ig-like domain-containing protein, partial [Gallionella sp.]|nr:Ig-like domain-containing protein [Gallionella sp.]